MAGSAAMRAWPNPARGACAFEAPARGAAAGRLIVYDLGGRIVRMLTPAVAAGRMRATWDGTDAHGVRVRAGTYFARWEADGARCAARVVQRD
jgi:flagellar hook assembly protein FlgD